MSEQKKRLKWLDCAKGIAIFLVVLGHALTSAIRADSKTAYTIFACIYYMHMPFFMLLSGMSYQIGDKKYKESGTGMFLGKKAKNLLLPYVVYGTIVFAVFITANLLPEIGDMMKHAGYGPISVGAWFKGLLIGDNVYCVHIWYIYVLFLFTAVTFLARKYLSYFADSVLLVLAVVLYVIKATSGYPQTEAYSNLCNWAIWFYMGLKLPMGKLNAKLGGLSFVAGCVCFWLNYLGIVPFAGYTGGFLLEFLVKCAVVLGLLAVIKAVCENGNTVLEFLGTHSMEVYLFHQPFFGSCFGSVFYGVIHFPAALVVVVSVLLSFGVPLALGYLLRRTRWLKTGFGLK